MSTQDWGRERRERQRAKVAFDLKVESDRSEGHEFYTGLIKDMSSGGLFIASRDLLPRIGDQFRIRFSFPPAVEEPVEVLVAVRWQRLDENNPDAPPGVGVQFLDLDPAIAARLNRFIAKHDVLLYEDDDYSEWGNSDS
ncbi:MAG: PilZ domain-containing protein [Deltaproteobacteria bacterium]|nr:PilZ domain-containing protein [Deltaproteobacteria bacterium]